MRFQNFDESDSRTNINKNAIESIVFLGLYARANCIHGDMHIFVVTIFHTRETALVYHQEQKTAGVDSPRSDTTQEIMTSLQPFIVL